MEITLEQVERLREKAAVSYGQAKAALEYSGGNLLDALIYLEERGVIPRPEDAYYSTKGESPSPPVQDLPLPAEPAGSRKKRRRGGLRRLLIDTTPHPFYVGAARPVPVIPSAVPGQPAKCRSCPTHRSSRPGGRPYKADAWGHRRRAQ